jgi:hypothetical protein
VTPQEIIAAWSRLRLFHEPLLRDERYLLGLKNFGADGDAEIIKMKLLWAEEPAFFDAYDYRWVLEPSAYDFTVEAVWQERLLGMLATWHAGLPEVPSPLLGRMDDLCVRLVFAFDMRTATPLTPPQAKRPRFIVVPVGFVELMLLLFRAALRQGADRTSALHALILKSLAPELIGDPEDTRQLRMLERVAPHHTAYFASGLTYGDGVEWSTTESDPCYAALDFVMLHEAAHVLAADSAKALEAYVATESAADLLALDIYGKSWGRREIRLDSCPYVRPLSLYGGALLFFSAIEASDRLRQGLYRHLGVIDAAGSWAEKSASLSKDSALFAARTALVRPEIERRKRTYLALGDEALDAHSVALLEGLIAAITTAVDEAIVEIGTLTPETLDTLRQAAALIPGTVDGPLDPPGRPGSR